MMKKLLTIPKMIILGIIIGILSKTFDLYTQNLGNIFSELSIFILLGLLISLESETNMKAMLNLLAFCVSMVMTYYLTAIITHSIYNYNFIMGWLVIAIISPLFAYITRLTLRRGLISIVIKFLILITTLSISIIVFKGPRIYDIVIIGLIGYLLFKERKNYENK